MKKNGTQIKEYFENIESLTGKQDNPLNVDFSKFNKTIKGIVKKLEQYSDTLSIADFMEITGIGKTKLWKIVKSGELKTINVHGQFRIIPRIWALEYIESQKFITYIKNYRMEI